MKKQKDNIVYRSSDDKVFAVVCSGLEHKIGLNKNGLRFAFVIGSLFWGITFWAYIACWLIFPARSTYNS